MIDVDRDLYSVTLQGHISRRGPCRLTLRRFCGPADGGKFNAMSSHLLCTLFCRYMPASIHEEIEMKNSAPALVLAASTHHGRSTNSKIIRPMMPTT